MWLPRIEELPGGHGHKYYIENDSLAVSYEDVLDRWQKDADYRTFFINLLAESPYAAFRWETPPVNAATMHRPFEFVLLNSPGVARHPDANAFVAFFDKEAIKRGVVEFANLGKDATLVVPCPNGPADAYGHLAAFARKAPEPQQHALWQAVGAAMVRRLGTAPVWLSTAGAGVSWLHVRLDDRPKYYGHDAYRDESGAIVVGPAARKQSV